jgi:hypothetical protein
VVSAFVVAELLKVKALQPVNVTSANRWLETPVTLKDTPERVTQVMSLRIKVVAYHVVSCMSG